MFYVIYKITNQINGKYYIGRHATNNINDGYMGSGIAIQRAIKKYGKENFTKEIIAMSDSRENLWELEKIVVNEDVVKDSMSYNNAYGGKHYLDGLKKHDNDAFIKHQSDAGKIGGKVSIANRTKEWHQKGGSKSSRKRASQYLYRLKTANGKEFILDGNQLKDKCKENNWNYDTLIWTRHKDREVLSGPLKGFRLDQIANPYKEVVKGK